MKFATITPDKLIFAPETIAARALPDPKSEDYAEFIQLKKAISDSGILNIFSVTERDGGYMVLDGNRRGLAIQQLWAEADIQTMERYPDGIQVQVLEADDADVLLTQISGNANVVKQKVASLAKALHRALLMTNITITELARRIGRSEAYTEVILKLNTLPEHIKAAVDQGEITATNAFHLNKLPVELLNDEMVDQAKILSGPDFANLTDKVKKEFLKAKKAGEETPVDGNVVFDPSPKLRMKTELEAMYKIASDRANDEPTEANVAYAEAMRWCFRMDAETLELDRQTFELALKDKEAKKADRAKGREEKKRADLLASIQADPKLLAEVSKLKVQ